MCYTCVNLRAKRDVDHAFKTKTKPKRANSTKTKHSMSLHCVKIIHAHIGHAKRVVACSWNHMLSVTSITLLKPKQSPSVPTRPKHSISLHCVKIIHAHIGHAKRVVACSWNHMLSVTSITLLKPKQSPSVLTWPKRKVVCPFIVWNQYMRILETLRVLLACYD